MTIISTGINGLDEILNGGFKKGFTYLVKGYPGTGKTIFGLQFLLEGLKNNEKCAYISFDEPVEEIKMQADTFNWNVDRIFFVDKTKDLEISDTILFFDIDKASAIQDFVNSIKQLEALKEVDRVFIDGIASLRDAIRDPAILRRILTSITSYLNSMNATTIISSDMSTEFGKEVISYVVSGEFLLEKKVRKDGKVLRVIDVQKYRSGKVHMGKHYFDITSEGIVVYPAIIPTNLQKKNKSREIISTGNKELDEMLNGGIYQGSLVIIAGSSGVGKTNLTLQILMENDKKGRNGIYLTFEEEKEDILDRYKELFNYEPKNLIIKYIDIERSLGELWKSFLEDIKLYNPSIIALDPINSLFDIAFTEEEANRYIRMARNVVKFTNTTAIAVEEIYESLESFIITGVKLSLLADYIILGRFVEMESELIKTIAVIKNKFGKHEKNIRILDFEEKKGLKISKPLKEHYGIMRGIIEKREKINYSSAKFNI